jgi:serine-type D-Ala-D-Ala carboxypeptidase/endopeptidase
MMATDRQELYRSLDPLVAQFASDNHVPGCALGIVAEGQLQYVKPLGVREVRSGAPVTADSVFRIASMTKMVTALGILHLRDRGLLSFDATVESIVPELKSLRYPTRDSRRLRVSDLLSHSTGFVTDDPWGDRQLDMSEAAFSSFLAEGFPFARAPGVAYEYSNTGFAILGRIIANQAGEPYDAYMRRHFLTPLGMASSGWEIGDLPAGYCAHGYSWIAGECVEQPTLGHGAYGAMGGLCTTANDYAKFVAWLLSAWPPRDDPDGPILARSSIRELAQGDGFPLLLPPGIRSVTEADTAARYGLGMIAVADSELGPWLTHSGGLPGYGSNVLFLPERGLGIFLFANVTYPHPAAALTVREAALTLVRSGEFPPRCAEPLPELHAAGAAIRAMYAAADVAAGGQVLAINLLLDRSAERRNAELATLQEGLGAITGVGALETEHAMAGTFTYACERGRLQAKVLLAPTCPATIQRLDFTALALG